MMAAAKLFLQLEDLLDAVEAKLREAEDQISANCIDWTDADEALLGAWRKAGGSSTGEWEWYARAIGADAFDIFADTRELVIAKAREELGFNTAFEIVEACHWQDDIRQGDVNPFAETRNGETIAAQAHIPAELTGDA